MKSRSEIWIAALEELGSQCSVDTARDAETCERRATQEGDSFFKVTLPLFAKDLEMALSVGHVPTSAFKGWARRNRTLYVLSDDSFAEYDGKYLPGELFRTKVAGGIPRFLGGFMDLVFEDDRVISKTAYDDVLTWILHESTEYTMSEYAKPALKDLLPPTLCDFVSYSEADGITEDLGSFPTPSELRTVDELANAIHAIRQLCLMFSKEKELPAQRDIDNAIARFVEIDEELETPLMQSDIPGHLDTPYMVWGDYRKDSE